MSFAVRVGVPLKRRCSRKCEVPASLSGSSLDPTSNQNPTETERTSDIRSVTIVAPESRVVRSNFMRDSSGEVRVVTAAKRSLAVLESPRRPLARGASASAVPATSVTIPASSAVPVAPAPIPAGFALSATNGRSARLFDRLAGLHLTFQPRHGGEVDASLRIDSGDFHFEGVADLDCVLDPVDPSLAEFGDVNESIAVRGDVDECTESRR